MIDTTASATPMPPQPVATETNPEALPLPPDPLPNAVAPSVTDPVPNLDFLPADDAFALEMRSETIEQLVGGDALRRGVSERIEAGRSQTNADLVAGHDRVRVQGTLHEHTGHGLAEQSAHLHTTVDGTLDVHAGCEDTVLLAGHMRDLWDGGAAIVAAMTDDTAAGGGIRVTTPLDLWVHGLMGVEERIGTCTADAVLMELGATHYEREYGPGVHAAGLAVYTGSLYQSSRSSFRPLMRVSSGVRNLIAGGDGGGAGGGSDGGAGSAPGASPPPATAHTGAAAKSATRTLAAGRGAVEAPATALDAADALTDARRVPLEELVDSVDARATEETGEAGIVMRAEDLPELTRCADTAEQLGALRETLRTDKAASGSGAAGGFRGSEFEGTVSMHPAGGGGGPLEIEPPSAAYGEIAPMVRPHLVDPWGQGPEVKLGLPGGADRPPQSTVRESDIPAVIRRLRELKNHYNILSRTDIVRELDRASGRTCARVVRLFEKFGGNKTELPKHPSGINQTDRAYRALQEMARQAETHGNGARAGAIRAALNTLDMRAVDELQALTRKYGTAAAPSTQAMQPPPATAESTVTVAAIPSPAHTRARFDWITAFRQLRDLTCQFLEARWGLVHADFSSATHRISNSVMHWFGKLGGHPEHLPASSSGATRAEQAYCAIQDMARRATESRDVMRANEIRRALEVLDQIVTGEMEKLTTKHGVLDALSTRAAQAMQTMQTIQTIRTIRAMQAARAVRLPPVKLGPTTSATPPVTVASATVASAGRLGITGPTHPILGKVAPAFPEPPGGLVHTTDVPSPPSASSLPGPSLADAAGTEASGLGLGRLDPPSTSSGTTAAHPPITEPIVTPSLADTSSFWLQPVDPVPAPGTGSFGFGLLHAGETVQPPPVTTAPSSTAPVLSRGAAFPTPARVDDDLAIKRALLTGKLPPRFDASRLIAEARTFEHFRLAEELEAGRLPMLAIDVLIDGYRITDEGGRNAPYIEYLRSLKESIERALYAAYPGRVDPQWLDQALELPRRRGELAEPSAALATVPAEFELTEIHPFLGTGESVSHPAPLSPPSAAGRIGAGAAAPPCAADPWRIRPPGMGGEPHPFAFDPWPAPPSPSRQFVHAETIRPPAPSTGSPPGWQGAETPGFARAASGAVELPFSRREEIALRFDTEDALLDAELTGQLGGADALGWSVGRWRDVFDDLGWINTIAQLDSAAAAAAGGDVDWRAIEELMRILDDPAPSP